MSLQNKKKTRISPGSYSNTKLDRISNLPGNVVDQILSFLPIKDAVKTSILSTNWRYKYATSPSLVFDARSFPSPLGRERLNVADKLASLVDRVLLLHSGPIHKFELSFEHTLPANVIEKWVLHLPRRHLEVLILKTYDIMRFLMPSSVFSCQNLTRLELFRCVLRPPSAFGGFENLKSLYLSDVDVDQGVLESMISSSPRLEIFTFICVVIELRIDAPNLRQLTIEGYYVNISLENTSRLTVFSMDAKAYNDDYEDGSHLKNLLAGMPRIQRLDLDNYSLECMANGDVPLVDLHHLSIGINLTHTKESSALLCLLRSAPNLQELDINSLDRGNEETSCKSWEYSGYWNCQFTRLRYVRISNFCRIKAEMDFIDFVLSTSLALETMAIKLNDSTCFRWGYDADKEMLEVAKQLLSFSRASPKAKIIFLE